MITPEGMGSIGDWEIEGQFSAVECIITPHKCHRGVVSLGGINEPDLDPIAADLCFTVTIPTAGLSVPPYSDYQQFIHDKIAELREQGWENKQIAEWLRENGYKTARGKRFYGKHAHSILKRMR